MMLTKKYILILCVMGWVSPSLALTECVWSGTHASSLDARIDLSVVSGGDLAVQADHSSGRFVMVGPSTFVWVLKKGRQKHLYHGSGEYLKYYRATAGGRYQRKGTQKIDDGWIGTFSDLLFNPMQVGQAYTMKSSSQGGGECVAIWEMKSRVKKVPPFAKMKMVWKPVKSSFHKIQSIELEEHLGVMYRLVFDRLEWGVSYTQQQISDISFVISKF